MLGKCVMLGEKLFGAANAALGFQRKVYELDCVVESHRITCKLTQPHGSCIFVMYAVVSAPACTPVNTKLQYTRQTKPSMLLTPDRK